ACLVGVRCRYDCQEQARPQIIDLLNQGIAVAVCPEQLGGLTTPRAPAERHADVVITIQGADVSSNYLQRAREALDLLKRLNIKKAILKSKSPMCGKDLIYDGSFTGQLTGGQGVLTELLLANAIEVECCD